MEVFVLGALVVMFVWLVIVTSAVLGKPARHEVHSIARNEATEQMDAHDEFMHGDSSRQVPVPAVISASMARYLGSNKKIPVTEAIRLIFRYLKIKVKVNDAYEIVGPHDSEEE